LAKRNEIRSGTYRSLPSYPFAYSKILSPNASQRKTSKVTCKAFGPQHPLCVGQAVAFLAFTGNCESAGGNVGIRGLLGGQSPLAPISKVRKVVLVRNDRGTRAGVDRLAHRQPCLGGIAGSLAERPAYRAGRSAQPRSRDARRARNLPATPAGRRPQGLRALSAAVDQFDHAVPGLANRESGRGVQSSPAPARAAGHDHSSMDGQPGCHVQRPGSPLGRGARQ
jgi:hypothetical protein